MKQCKRLSALLLAVCLIVSMIVPAVYAEGEDLKTVTYDFDFVGIAQGLGQDVKSNALNKAECQEQIAALKEAGHINWCYKDISFTNTATNCPNFTAFRYFRGRAVVGDWLALTIDNPGAGTWKLDMEYIVTLCGAQQVNAYILPGSVTDIAGSLSDSYLVGSYNCYNKDVSSDSPNGTNAKLIHETAELSQWTAGSVEENPTYTLVLQSKKENGSEKKAVGVADKLAANIHFSKLTMTEVKAEAPEEDPKDEAKNTAFYNFDLQDLYKELGVEIDGADLIANDKCKNQLNAVNESHADAMNWNFKDINFTLSISAPASFHANGFFRGRTNVGDWVAFTVENPGEGEWNVTVARPLSQYGAGKVNVYILPADTADIAGALTDANRIGSYSCYDKDSKGGDNPVKDAIASETLGKTWNAGSDDSYILVFQTAEAAEGAKASRLFLAGVTMDRIQKEEPKEDTVYNFDILKIATDNNVDFKGADLLHEGGQSCRDLISTLYGMELIDWTFKDINFPMNIAAKASFNTNGYFRGRTDPGDWVAFNIDNPGAGEWNVKVARPLSQYGASRVNMYILPADTTDIPAALTSENLIGGYSCYDKASNGGDNPTAGSITESVLSKTWTAGTEDSYILVFQTAEKAENAKASRLFLASVTMAGSEGGSGDVNVTVDPVAGEIAHEDTVASVNCLHAAVDEIDGVDYIYLLFNGNKMYVYNLDTGAMVDKESNCFGTPRAIYIGDDHIVWVTGAAGSIYKYDPFTKTGKMISMSGGLFPNAGSFNAEGITGDGQGNLYFGTYNVAYLGKYNIETGTFSQLGDWLCAPGYEPDAVRAGDAGLIYKDGFLYFGIDGDKNNDGTPTHMIVKFDLATNKIVDFVDINPQIDGNLYLDEIVLLGDVILASSANGKTTKGSIAIDISGEKMKRIDIPGLESGFNGAVSPEINGKVYLMSNNNKGLLEYDIAQRKITAENVLSTDGSIVDKGSLKFRDCLVTVEGNEQMPGQSLVTFISDVSNNRTNIVLYNLQTKNVVTLTDFTQGQGSGNSLRALEVSPDGKTIYVSSYGWNHMSVYDVASGKVLAQYPTINTQIEGIIWYEGKLYIGNYSSSAASVMDPATGKFDTLMQFGDSPFSQARMHATAAGDGMVFFGTAPDQFRLGGVMAWYDIANERVYVAAGPNPEDVFYTPSGIVKGTYRNQEWFSALTGEKVLTDADSDTITVNGQTVQRFTGVVKNQSINCMVYRDGYIYGCTTRSGGSSSVPVDDNNACIFVYDVAAMKLVGTYDLAEAIPGLKTGKPIEFVDVIAEDPDMPGKFWGVVSDTLFSFTYNEAQGFVVKTELSLGTTGYNHGSNLFQSRELLFDGDFMYVIFGSYGTYMINKDDPTVNFRLSGAVPKVMVQAYDGNLYYHDNTTDLKVLKIAETAQKIKDTYGAQKAQDLINALDPADQINLDDEAAVNAARKAYDNLSDEAKAKINAEKLIAAEAVVKPLREAADKAAADAVIAQIAAIGEVTLEDENAIRAARAAYNALTSGQKKLVTNAADLKAAEEKLADMKTPEADKEMAAAVDAKIEAIGTVTRYSAEVIKAARAAYENLTPEQKPLVKKLNVLTAAEAEHKAIMEALTALYNFDYINTGLSYEGNSLYYQERLLMHIENHYANGSINWKVKEVKYTSDSATTPQFNGAGYFQGRAYPGDWLAFTVKNPGAGIYDLTISYVATFCGAEEVAVYIIPADTKDIAAAMTEDALVGVFNCYDASVKTEKPTLEAKRSSALGTWAAGDAEEYIAVYKCAKASEESLANIPVRQANGETVRDFGSNVYFCQLTMVKADEEVLAVQEKIDAIGEVTLNSEEAIKAARAAYDALSDGQKAGVDITALTAAETKLAELKAAAEKEAADKAAADAVIKQIDAIGEVTLNSEEAIKAARAAYEALTAEQKKLVDTAKLVAAEAKLAELKAAADAVIKQIDAIGTVTLESKAAITAARAAYEALTAEQKTLVSNLNVLTAAEASLAALEVPKTGEASLMLLAGILVLSAAAVAVLLADKKRFANR